MYINPCLRNSNLQQRSIWHYQSESHTALLKTQTLASLVILNSIHDQVTLLMGDVLPHRGQMAENHIHGVYRIGADWLIQHLRFRHAPSCENLVQHVPADQRHEPNVHFEQSVLSTFARQGHIQIHLQAPHKQIKMNLYFFSYREPDRDIQ